MLSLILEGSQQPSELAGGFSERTIANSLIDGFRSPRLLEEAAERNWWTHPWVDLQPPCIPPHSQVNPFATLRLSHPAERTANKSFRYFAGYFHELATLVSG